MKYISKNLKDTEKIASKLAKSLKPNDIIAYKGSMGMGKTAFTRALVVALGGDDVVSSPTFAIMNEYQSKLCPIYHFDMYRVTSVDDLYSTGFFDFLDTNSLIIIEWSENIEDCLPKNTIFVDIALGEEETERIILIDKE